MYHCYRCHRPMRANRWGWFEHLVKDLVSVLCAGQSAYWAEVE